MAQGARAEECAAKPEKSETLRHVFSPEHMENEHGTPSE